eukprot:4874520-Pleurochrysis_carterae.AAC.1
MAKAMAAQTRPTMMAMSRPNCGSSSEKTRLTENMSQITENSSRLKVLRASQRFSTRKPGRTHGRRACSIGAGA